MIGLSDVPVVGVAVDRISSVIVDAGVRGLRYLLCYKTLVNELNYELDNLMIQEERVARKVHAERADGKIIRHHVVEWQQQVENIKATSDELSTLDTSSCTCLKVLPLPDPTSRFRLGRKAAYLGKYVADLTESGQELLVNEIGYAPATEGVPLPYNTFQEIESRQEAYPKVQTLVDEDGDPMTGIYGVPGVGKTTMMKQVLKEAKEWNTYQEFDSRQEAYQKLSTLLHEDGDPVIGIYGMPGVGKTQMMNQLSKMHRISIIFDNVIQANVGTEDINVIELQAQLARDLDCKFESMDDEVSRASQLRDKLMTGGKTLVLLDDIWDVIPLNNIGIPFGDDSSNGCKILLTSRIRDVCLLNHCNDPIEIKALTDAEAFQMFNKTVGAKKIKSLQDPRLAEKVYKECAGLPLLIQAVGRALKFEDESSWSTALDQLEKGLFAEIKDIDPQIDACFRLSFEKITDTGRTCLLMCSLFPEDADIETKLLFDLATGFQLLEGKGDIRPSIDILKSSSLLLQGEDYYKVKMNDIIRDVARTISAKDPKYGFLSCRSSLWDNAQYHTVKVLQLDLEVDDVLFPEVLVCPDLHTLWLQCNNRPQQHLGGILQRFTNISCMFVKDMSLVEHLLPIHTLDKLRVLILDCCTVDETFLNSIPRNLEILTIWECKFPSPLCVPDLKNLKKLEISSKH